MAAAVVPVASPTSAQTRERIAAIAASDVPGAGFVEDRVPYLARNLPSHGLVIRMNAAAERDIGMPATMLGTPVDRCTARSSARGAPANRIPLAWAASHVGE